MGVDLPPGGRMRFRPESEHALEGAKSALEFHARPLRRGLRYRVLPTHMIESMQAYFEPGVVDGTHLGAALRPDIGARQQYAVQQCLQSIVFEHGRARHLLGEPLAKNAAHGAPRMIGSHRKIERGVHTVLLQQGREPRDAFARAAQRVDIDLEADACAFKHRWTAMPMPTAGFARRNRKWL